MIIKPGKSYNVIIKTDGCINVDDNIKDFCCVGYDYIICLIMADPVDSVWGCCQNMACPNAYPGDEVYNGISNNYIDDFEDKYDELRQSTIYNPLSTVG